MVSSLPEENLIRSFPFPCFGGDSLGSKAKGLGERASATRGESIVGTYGSTHGSSKGLGCHPGLDA